jgi:hypothetical protein
MDYLSEEEFCDILSDTSSTGYSDKYPMFYLNPSSDLQLPVSDLVGEHISETDDFSVTYICEICHKNIIKLEEPGSKLRKKRKRSENQLITASMKVCDECRNLNLEDLKKLSGSASCKRVVKREHAKRRVQETENLKNLKEQQEKQIDDNSDLTDLEKKKMKQVIRNRISAQQSRDRKKAYIKEMEQENNEIKQQVSSLKRKLHLLHQENQYLKNQLAQMHFGGSPSTGALKVATLGIATLLSVFVLLNSISDSTATPRLRQLSSQLDLSMYKTSEGVDLQTVAEQVVNEASNEGLLVPFQENHPVVQYRQQRFEALTNPGFLQTIDPCRGKIESKALATMVCPSVQTYWENGKDDLKHIQLIVPLESLPSIGDTVLDTSGQKYMIEILCAVNEINVLPVASSI